MVEKENRESADKKGTKRMLGGLRTLFMLLLAAILVIQGLYWYISLTTNPYIYSDRAKLPANKVGVVPGTSKRMSNGESNDFFNNRIKAAAELYFSHKITKILLSGDNREENYNEPLDMKKALLKLHVPENDIFLDHAGLSTLESIVRARDVFSLDSFTFISQRFQLQRALFISRHKGINCVGYVADDPKGNWQMLKVQIRENLARVKSVLDVFVLNTRPAEEARKYID